MPLVDMPIEELKKYNGTNPKPADFDVFWDKSLEEMEEINPDVELVKADFQVSFAECYHMYFTGVGGARIHAKLLKPKNISGKNPAVLRFHGYHANSGDWFFHLPYVAMGYTVAALDCRGQGGLSQDLGGVTGTTVRGHIIRGIDDVPEKLLYRQIFLDTAEMAKIVMAMPEVDEERVGALGGSQGGGLTLACASLVPQIKKVAPNCPFICDYKRVWDMDLAKDAYDELKQYFRRHDPLHKREDEIFNKLGYIDVQNLVHRIKGEVIIAVGLMDTICPPSTQFAAYNKITSKKSLAIYPDFGHEDYPGHNDTVLEFMSEL
jgi:cephalosporin-C deacetylase